MWFINLLHYWQSKQNIKWVLQQHLAVQNIWEILEIVLNNNIFSSAVLLENSKNLISKKKPHCILKTGMYTMIFQWLGH